MLHLVYLWTSTIPLLLSFIQVLFYLFLLYHILFRKIWYLIHRHEALFLYTLLYYPLFIFFNFHSSSLLMDVSNMKPYRKLNITVLLGVRLMLFSFIDKFIVHYKHLLYYILEFIARKNNWVVIFVLFIHLFLYVPIYRTWYFR